MNGNKLSTIQQDSKQILAKSKSLLDTTRKILAEKSNRDITKNFTHKIFYLQGHISTVTSLAITSDDKKVVSGSDDNTIKIWDISTGMCIKTFEGHTGSVNCIAITPDGKHIVSGSYDNTIKIWDISTGMCIKTLEGYAGSVNSLAITPDGKFIVSGNGSYIKSVGSIKLWDIQSGKELRSFEGHTGSVICIAITPDEKYIVSGSNDKTIKIWDISSGVCIKTLEGHDKRVNCVVIIDNGKKIVSGSDDKTIKIWDMLSGECTKTDNNIINYSAFNITPDEKKIVSIENSVISLWDIESHMCVGKFFGHSDFIASMAISSDGKKIVSGSFDKTIKIWDIQNATFPKIYKTQEDSYYNTNFNSICFTTTMLVHTVEHSEIVDIESGESIFTTNAYDVQITPDNKKAVTYKDGTIKLWDIQSGKELHSFDGHTGSVNCIAITPDGKHIVSGSHDNTIKIWDISTGMCIKTLEGHDRYVNYVVITPDSKKIISDGDGNTFIWDIENGEIIHRFREGIEYDQIVCINNIFIFGYYSEIKIINIESGKCMYMLDTFKGKISNIKISPDGKQIISTSHSYGDDYDETYLQVWDLNSRRCTHTFITDSVFHGTFTSDSKKIVITNEKNIEIWEINSGLCTQTFETHNCVLNNVAITPNGKQIVSSGSDDKIIKFWDIADGSYIKTLRGFLHNVTKFVITPCGKWLYAISNNSWEGDTPGSMSFIQMWDILNSTCCKTVWYSSGYVSNINIMPDNKKIIFLWAESFYDNYKVVLDIESGNNIEYPINDDTVWEITPNGKQVVCGDGEGPIYIKDLESGEYLKTLEEHDTCWDLIDITPDSKKVISICTGNTIKIWDMHSGECLKSFKVDLDLNTINTTGEYIFSKNTDKTIHVWNVKSGEKVHEVIKPSRDALVVLYKNEQLIGFVK